MKAHVNIGLKPQQDFHHILMSSIGCTGERCAITSISSIGISSGHHHDLSHLVDTWHSQHSQIESNRTMTGRHTFKKGTTQQHPTKSNHVLFAFVSPADAAAPHGRPVRAATTSAGRPKEGTARGSWCHKVDIKRR